MRKMTNWLVLLLLSFTVVGCSFSHKNPPTVSNPGQWKDGESGKILMPDGNLYDPEDLINTPDGVLYQRNFIREIEVGSEKEDKKNYEMVELRCLGSLGVAVVYQQAKQTTKDGVSRLEIVETLVFLDFLSRELGEDVDYFFTVNFKEYDMSRITMVLMESSAKTFAESIGVDPTNKEALIEFLIDFLPIYMIEGKNRGYLRITDALKMNRAFVRYLKDNEPPKVFSKDSNRFKDEVRKMLDYVKQTPEGLIPKGE